MPSSYWKFSLLGLLLLLASHPAAAVRPQPPVVPEIPHLASLTRSSGYIFSGTVKSVERIAADRQNGVAVMRIAFRVDDPIRGVHKGQTLVIREWTGLWQSGERYRPGEHLMLFLYPPSKLGLTSPVGGAMGRFSVDPGGRVIIPPGRRGGTPPKPGRKARSSPELRISVKDIARAVGLAEREE